MKAKWAVAAAMLLSASALQSQSSADSSEQAHLQTSTGWARIRATPGSTTARRLGAGRGAGHRIAGDSRRAHRARRELPARRRRPAGQHRFGASSSFHDFSTTADLRLTLFRWRRLEPFAGAGIGAHFLGNDIAGDEALRGRYNGTELGAQFFGGMAIDLPPTAPGPATSSSAGEVPHVGRTT